MLKFSKDNILFANSSGEDDIKVALTTVFLNKTASLFSCGLPATYAFNERLTSNITCRNDDCVSLVLNTNMKLSIAAFL